MQYSETQHTLIGRVRNYKFNATPEQIVGWLNDTVRDIQDRRAYWSDSLVRGIISIPDAYSTGTISLETGNQMVTGVGTAWPVSDKVNTTLLRPISGSGYQAAQPTVMTGISDETILLVDAGTPSAEAVAVVRTSAVTFTAQFRYPHAAGVPVTSSSLSGLQFRAGSSHPIFLVMAVHSAESIELELPWGGADISDGGYQIVKMWCTPAPGLRKVMNIVDQRTGRPLRINTSQMYVDVRDPQRNSQGDPAHLVDMPPSHSGNVQYELWPTPVAARQIAFVGALCLPEFKNPSDRGPYFINPEILVNGATARALRSKVKEKDPCFDPVLAREFEGKYERQFEQAVNADESRAVREYTNLVESLGASQIRANPGSGANYWQSHERDVDTWNM